MNFRPCIDIHNGKVKQIVGGSLNDEGDQAQENFVSDMEASDFAKLYRERGLPGGHVILLNAKDSEYYTEDLRQAEAALGAYPGGLQAGGGITCDNARFFLEAGASHVIITSYVFADGSIRFDRLEKLRRLVGKEHLVLDLSCRKKNGRYYPWFSYLETITCQLHEGTPNANTKQYGVDEANKGRRVGASRLGRASGKMFLTPEIMVEYPS